MKFLIIVACIITLLSSNAEAKNKRRHQHKNPGHSSPVPVFSVKSYLVANEDGTIIKEQAGDTIRPMASISKLMLALLVSQQDLTESLTIPSIRQVQSLIPRTVSKLTREELLTLALIRSDNLAAQVLCTHLHNCVDSMNEKAIELGMINTEYKEPTGLDNGNVSTAHDLLKLLMVASHNQTITEISSQSNAEISTNRSPIKMRNTNPLTAKLDIILSKTGFTNAAGGCLVMIINSPTGYKMFILLGSRNTHTRIHDMEKLIKES